jgi:hypothetical protein
MILALITLVIALTISAVAAYYSIIGLIAIFSAAAIPIAVMGIVLEAGKLITASWLYQNWKAVVTCRQVGTLKEWIRRGQNGGHTSPEWNDGRGTLAYEVTLLYEALPELDPIDMDIASNFE